MTWAIRRRRPAVLAAVAALAAASAALAGAGAVPVVLTASSTTLLPGKPVTVAVSGKLAKGNRLVIQRWRPGGKPTPVKECAVSPCRATWAASVDDYVVFQGLAVKRVGKKTTVLGRSRTIGVTWEAPAPPEPPAPAPAPPPAPAAVPGHYEGRTSQNEIFAFDVSADGGAITGLHTGQINQSCDPPAYLYAGNLTNWRGPVGRDGTFVMSYDGPATVDGLPATERIAISGKVASGTASGSIRVDTSWTEEGTTYTCSSGAQTWTATKV
jgi:hypothetical protein